VRSEEEVAARLDALGPVERILWVGVDGGGGAGKSTFAERLRALRDDVQVVHLDDFYSGDPWVGYDAYDHERFRREVVEPLLRGERARFRRYDWHARELAEWHALEPHGVVVVEGVFALRPELLPLYDVTVWVETPPELRLARGLERDGDGARALWARWMAQEDEYAARERVRDLADVVVAGL